MQPDLQRSVPKTEESAAHGGIRSFVLLLEGSSFIKERVCQQRRTLLAKERLTTERFNESQETNERKHARHKWCHICGRAFMVLVLSLEGFPGDVAASRLNTARTNDSFRYLGRQNGLPLFDEWKSQPEAGCEDSMRKPPSILYNDGSPMS